jgi:hypothetical protein
MQAAKRPFAEDDLGSRVLIGGHGRTIVARRRGRAVGGATDAHRLVTTIGSTGRCNTSLKSFSGRLVV